MGLALNEGDRPPIPPGRTAAASQSRWQKVHLRQCGGIATRVLTRTVLWYCVRSPAKPITESGHGDHVGEHNGSRAAQDPDGL